MPSEVKIYECEVKKLLRQDGMNIDFLQSCKLRCLRKRELQ